MRNRKGPLVDSTVRQLLEWTRIRQKRRTVARPRRITHVRIRSVLLNNIITLRRLLGLYFGVFLVCAVILQIRDGDLSPTAATAMDAFSGGLLWIASFIALIIAASRKDNAKRLLMWLAVSAVTGALAIDEVFEFHEMSSVVIGDDDYIKLFIWMCSAIGLFMILKLEEPPAVVTILFICGYILQTLYLVIDLGDGDFYVSPLPIEVANWAEEILELLFIQCYLAGLTLHHFDGRRDSADRRRRMEFPENS